MRPFALLALLLSLGGCQTATDAFTSPRDLPMAGDAGQTGVLVMNGVGPLVTIPATAVAGQEVTLRVTTFGHCDPLQQVRVERGETVFTGAGLTWSHRPMDVSKAITPGSSCPDSVWTLNHDVTTVFPETGWVNVNVIGRNLPQNRQYIVNGQVHVTLKP